MNVANFIFWLLHICNLPTLFVLIPLCPPCTPFANCAHLLIDFENTSANYIDFSIDCAHNFEDYANAPNDRANIVVDFAEIPNISSLNRYIPNFALL
jgi:hypothetical protein